MVSLLLSLVVLLADPVPEAWHHRKGIAQQDLLQVVKFIRISVNLPQQDIAADLYFFQDALQRCYFGAAVFQVNKNRKFTQIKNPLPCILDISVAVRLPSIPSNNVFCHSDSLQSRRLPVK